MAIPGRADLRTHEVANQPPDPGDRDLWADDPLLRHFAGHAGADARALAAYGAALGTVELRQAARDANRNLPELRLFDAGGRRLDEVAFHPAWHRFMGLSAAAGYHSTPWEGAPGGHATHAAMVLLASEVEPGHCCPLTMTAAGVPLLRAASGIGAAWLPKVLARDHDPAVAPAGAKRALTLGMAMTEKQGGSDLRTNATRAERAGDLWRLTGHKWFCSAPMSDGFFTLAQTGAGLSCFLVPRWLEGGRNGIRLMRLKDKLGNRSNASAEIEYDGALAHLVGDEGAGVRVILEMVHHTRLDTALAPVGLMRAALREALWWVTHRTAFQRRLIDQPLMRAVLADLTLDWAGALALGLHVARAFDGTTPEARAFARIGVAVAKVMANKLCPVVVAEAMEALGGMGYIEDTGLPLLYREAPLNGIWEGAANVICLDALRSLSREPLTAAVLAAELDAARGLAVEYDAALDLYRARWPGPVPEAEARWFVERTGLLLGASVLLRHGPAALAEAFVATRLAPDGRGRLAGAVAGIDADAVLAAAGGAEGRP
ncbi:MAG: acyl-CoA dehydrogenase family protein [Rubellimicrobium sp.]|nr:acyl-CoA dehydrogenase family protein [Rubellimicrobium sp.]